MLSSMRLFCPPGVVPSPLSASSQPASLLIEHSPASAVVDLGDGGALAPFPSSSVTAPPDGSPYSGSRASPPPQAAQPQSALLPPPSTYPASLFCDPTVTALSAFALMGPNGQGLLPSGPLLSHLMALDQFAAATSAPAPLSTPSDSPGGIAMNHDMSPGAPSSSHPLPSSSTPPETTIAAALMTQASCASPIDSKEGILGGHGSAFHPTPRHHHTDDDDDMQVYSRSEADARVAIRARIKQERLKTFIPGSLCRVCNDIATGIHYNVESCNGCKTFFRRVVMENRTYSCKFDGKCEIDKSKRCSCRHCRFKKCLRVGMDVTELNVEQRRKRKTRLCYEGLDGSEESDDPLVNLLMSKEQKFYALLTSLATPLHGSIQAALSAHKSFDDIALYQKQTMGHSDQHNFSMWRAKILSTIAEWAKSFEVFTKLNNADRTRLFTHSAFSNLVLCEAWYTPSKYTDRIVFPDGLVGFRNVAVNSDSLKDRSGLMPTVVPVINSILVPIRRMNMTRIEYLLLMAIIFFDPECLTLTEAGRIIVSAKRRRLLSSLKMYLDKKLSDPMEAACRFGALLLRLTNVQKVAAYKRDTMKTIDTFQLLSPHPLTMELANQYSESSFF